MAYSIDDNEINVYEANDPSTTLATVSASRINTLKEIDQISYLGDELVYDTMRLDALQEMTISGGSPVFDTQLIGFPYGSLFRHSNSGGSIDRTFFLDTSKQIGKHAYQYDLVSIIGMLDRQVFQGNVYIVASSAFTTFKDVLEDIVGVSGTLFDYDSSAVNSIIVVGWIPFGSKRDALQQLLFATNVHAFWDSANNRVVFKYISHTVQSTIADAKIFDAGSVEYPQLATKVNITEHSFYPKTYGMEAQTLFDNMSGDVVNNKLVKFQNAPIIKSTLTTTGTLTITNASTDSAYVSGRGTLTGVPYYHTTYPVEREANVTDRREYEVNVTDAYLISVLNSENVADRVADYYFNRFIVKAGIKVTNEACGNFYTLKDAFSVSRTGFLQKMEKVFSSFLKASCEFLCGVTQNFAANAFSHVKIFYYNDTLIDGNADPRSSPLTGTWTVPSGVTRIRVVLIGGGRGGDSGIPGEPGKSSGEGGAGGAAGASGHGGNIYEFTLDVTPGQIFEYSIGTGGAGGAVLPYSTYQSTQQSNAGSDGNDTTFKLQGSGTTYSSANGSPSTEGWYCLGTNTLLAQTGIDMSEGKGGNGGKAGTGSDASAETTLRAGEKGGNATFKTLTGNGGNGGSGLFATAPTSFATVNGMTVNQIVSQGVYIHNNGSTSLQTPTTGFAQAMKDYAAGAITYCNALSWNYQIGIPGGGGGGGAIGGTAYSGGAGQMLYAYPYCLVIDQQNLLRQDDSFCWHEIDTTYGGNGGNGANPGSYAKLKFSLSAGYGYSDAMGLGGRGGFGGGGGGGAGSSRNGQTTVSWLLAEFKESPTVPAVGSGGNGGKGQDGSDGGIIIYYT